MIDYGSDHHLSPENLYREILYPEIPAFASQIKLDRVYAKSGSWLTSDYETLLTTVPEYVKIVIKGPLNVHIPLAEVYSGDGISVNQLLVEKCPNLTRTDVEEGANSDDETVVIEEEYIEGSSDNVSSFRVAFFSLICLLSYVTCIHIHFRRELRFERCFQENNKKKRCVLTKLQNGYQCNFSGAVGY